MSKNYKIHFVKIPKSEKINKYYLFTICNLPAYMQDITTESQKVTCLKCINKLKTTKQKKESE